MNNRLCVIYLWAGLSFVQVVCHLRWLWQLLRVVLKS
jgi:hypothetical protein